MTEIEKTIFDGKIQLIEKYLKLNLFPTEFVWNEDEYKDYPYRLKLIEWFENNTVFERTQYGIKILTKL